MSEKSLSKANSFRLAGYRVEPSMLRVSGEGKDARLEAKAMQVLVYLAERAGQVVSRQDLEEQLWPGRVITEDALTNAIAKLRRVFGDDARHPRVIATIPKTGYRLIAEPSPISKLDEKRPTSSIPAISGGKRDWRTGTAWTAGAFTVLVMLVIAWWILGRDGTALNENAPFSGKPAIAVLPFENLSAAPDQDYFANGIMADLITDLSKVDGLMVIAPGSVFAYKDGQAAPRQVSAELDVDYVVVGSVQRSGEQLRVNVRLIEARAEHAIWGERYAGAPNDVFEMQDKLAGEVIAALKVELAPSERAILAKRPTASIAAYDYYLRGLDDHGRRTKAQNLSARDSFQEAIKLDPEFARAHAGLALTYSREAIDGWTPTPLQSLERAAELAGKAAAMDPSLPQVHFVTGQVDLFQRRHGKAIEAAERAITVDPNYADAYALSAWTLSYAGRPAEARSALDNAMRLSPRPPASYLEILGEIQFVQGRYDESASTFQRVLDINPDYTRARMWNAAALAQAGRTGKAEWEATELLVSNPGFSLTQLEFAFPFKDPRVLDTLLDGLRKAGLPD